MKKKKELFVMNSNKAKNTKNIIHLLNDRTNTSKSIRPNEFDAPIELLEADGVIHCYGSHQ